MKKEKDITITISNILKVGVYISSFLILVGIILTFISGTGENLSIERYTFQEMITGLFKFDHYSYMMFGIFVLILTPVLRILGLLVVYLKEKDYKFVCICIIVLLILCISLALGVTHN
ncbi:DUF1634 domain-containing protein [Gemella sanguinis]|jgi:integral membrane protein|uniref:DUF1634 domain-containing protein n=1 Tax=Gemella sanguinis TaxID=84135 RepID=UPI0004E18567|nr:DUF1634 domain-containing protein [Gemella sanguinis]NKZ25792.1 DUF1634 domain-containing protein [Gemella sanguinis]